MVINRYDWESFKSRGQEEIGVRDVDSDVDPDMDSYLEVGSHASSVGLVDKMVAKEQARRWKDQAAENRVQVEAGAWLYIPPEDYIFGRFGFNDTHDAARSFLFFSDMTDFTHTGFRGLSRSLREDEIDE